MRTLSRGVLSLLALLSAVSGCYRHHARTELDDAGTEQDATAADGATDDAGPCTITCPSPMLLAQSTLPWASAVPWAVVGLAASGERVAVLTAEQLDGGTEDAHYTLYLYTGDGSTLSRAPLRGTVSNVQSIDGILIAQPTSFVAVVLWRRGVRDERRAGLALIEWSIDGALRRQEDVLELPSLAEPDCPSCSVHASFVRQGEEVIVMIVEGDVLRTARLDLTSASASLVDAAALPFRRRRGEPVSGSSDGGRTIAAIGGTAAGAPPGEAALITIEDGTGLTIEQVPGVTNDPPPRLAPSGATLWRFVTDAARATDSAILGWEIGGRGLSEPAWRIPTAMGFPPTNLQILGGTVGPSILWSGLDLTDPERSDLYLVPLEGEVEGCDVVQPARVASFPWALRLAADQPFAAMRFGDDVLVAVLGEAVGNSTLALLRLPSCTR